MKRCAPGVCRKPGPIGQNGRLCRFVSGRLPGGWVRFVTVARDVQTPGPARGWVRFVRLGCPAWTGLPTVGWVRLVTPGRSGRPTGMGSVRRAGWARCAKGNSRKVFPGKDSRLNRGFVSGMNLPGMASFRARAPGRSRGEGAPRGRSTSGWGVSGGPNTAGRRCPGGEAARGDRGADGVVGMWGGGRRLVCLRHPDNAMRCQGHPPINNYRRAT
jgi:hypothetical protein